jgi:hypothetical protein
MINIEHHIIIQNNKILLHIFFINLLLMIHNLNYKQKKMLIDHHIKIKKIET